MARLCKHFTMTVDEYNVMRGLIMYQGLPFVIKNEGMEDIPSLHRNGRVTYIKKFCMDIWYEDEDNCLLAMLELFTREIAKNEYAKRIEA